ncbi:alpha-1,3-mannosyl-glycoprotein 4-beta-N-acetylglucosaminyltransferase B-like [Clytia hemisphaerica]|uniref:alpha-1,3-mannosyl-glycoprotein 4-beta-N-acetylglucosaminyltransferase B-like n=1 Tax=Clytia hemisphaerica TaxID=252671 RepID=UPI0034D6010D
MSDIFTSLHLHGNITKPLVSSGHIKLASAESLMNVRVSNRSSNLMVNGDVMKISKDWMKNADVVKNLTNPGFAGIHDIEKYFKSNNLKLGQKRVGKAFVVFGIPTVKRSKAYYVIQTVSSLLKHMKTSERKNVVIVIFVADLDDSFLRKVVKDVRDNFPVEVKDGIIQVVAPDKAYYPKNLDNLPRLFGDEQYRVRWRSKQCLDYSYLYYYCKDMAQYFVQLEDDIIAVDDYMGKMREFITKNEKLRWSVLEFGARGFIGMTYRGEHLESFAKFVRYFHWTMPVDLLFRVYNDIYLYKNPKNFRIKKPVFLHVGKFSSLDGQVRKLEDLQDIPIVGRRQFQSVKGNPVAEIESDLSGFYKSNKLENPYSSKGVMWATKPKDGDTLTIMFNSPQKIKRIFISSGMDGHKKDCFHETKLYISQMKGNANSKCGKFELVKFYKEAIVDITFDEPKKNVRCVKLELTAVQKTKGIPNWLIIEEIAILVS